MGARGRRLERDWWELLSDVWRRTGGSSWPTSGDGLVGAPVRRLETDWWELLSDVWRRTGGSSCPTSGDGLVGAPGRRLEKDWCELLADVWRGTGGSSGRRLETDWWELLAAVWRGTGGSLERDSVHCRVRSVGVYCSFSCPPPPVLLVSCIPVCFMERWYPVFHSKLKLDDKSDDFSPQNLVGSFRASGLET